jgi:hypothetical protein
MIGLKFGSSRVVFLFGKVAIKIPFSKCGIEQSRVEIEFFNKNKNAIFFPFAKILKTRGSIIFAERCSGIKNNVENAEIIRRADKIKFSFKQFDFMFGDIYRIENWGKNQNGEIVLLDYGLDERIQTKYYFKYIKKWID